MIWRSLMRARLQRPQTFGMLADEAQDSTPEPESSACEDSVVRDRRMCVYDDCVGNVPAFPTRFRGSVTEVDVLAVEPEAGIEPAELVDHLAAKEQERGEHPVSVNRLGRPLLELV